MVLNLVLLRDANVSSADLLIVLICLSVEDVLLLSERRDSWVDVTLQRSAQRIQANATYHSVNLLVEDLCDRHVG